MAQVLFVNKQMVFDRPNTINNFMSKHRQRYREIDLNSDKFVRRIQEIVDLLNRNNLEYWVMNGTLLGLIRDNKLIDWDDDIDFDFIVKGQNLSLETLINECLEKGYMVKIKKNAIFIGINIFFENLKISLGENRSHFRKTFNYGYKYPEDLIFPLDGKCITYKNIEFKLPSNPQLLCHYIYKDWTTEIRSKNEEIYLNKEASHKYMIKALMRVIDILMVPKNRKFIRELKQKIQL